MPSICGPPPPSACPAWSDPWIDAPPLGGLGWAEIDPTDVAELLAAVDLAVMAGATRC